MQPQLSLNYNSQGGNGLLGVGWSLGGLSVIHRCPATKVKDGFIGGINFDSNDRFCLDGQPLVAINGAYGANGTEYRTELDGFSKIVSYGSTGNGPQYFKVWTKSGDIMEYGNTADSHQNPPLANGTTQPDALCWLLNKVIDSVGNYMTVTYFEDETAGESYPLRIDYTGNATQSLTPYNSVEFEYETRTDISTQFNAGLEVKLTKRLKKITNNSSGADIRKYQLVYEQNAGTELSQIKGIEMCDKLGNCTQVTNFEWDTTTSTGWEQETSLEPADYNVQLINNGTSGGWSSLEFGTRYVDLNGDGLVDLVHARFYDSNNTSRKAYLNTGKKAHVEQITNGLGISIDIDYTPLTDNSVYTKGNSASYPQQDIQSPMYVVSQSHTDNGVGSQNTLNYTYAGAKADLSGRGFLGFASRTVEDATSGTTIKTNFRQEFPFTGRVSSTETHHGSVLISKEVNMHNQVATGTSTESGSTDPIFVHTSQSMSESFDLDAGALITTTTTTSSYDAYGNPTLITATTNDVGQPSFVTTTNNTYINDTAKWYLGQLTDTDVTKSLGGVASPTRSSSFEYDAVTGLLIKETIEPGSSMELMQTYTHDGYGNRISETTTGFNITSSTASTAYDAQGRFALTVTNALNHSETREYDPLLNQGWGQVTKLTGPNGLSTLWEYDTLGRIIKETRADGTQTAISYTFCDDSNPCPTLANGLMPSYFMTTTTDGAPLTKTYYDAVNREVLNETESFDGSLVSVQTEYNARTYVKRTSLPYFGNTPSYWSVNNYDNLDRLIQENSPDTGITSYTFDGLLTMVTNDLNQTYSERKNSRGQTLWTEDDNNNRIYYCYDANGNLTHVADGQVACDVDNQGELLTIPSGVNVITNKYDLRGFKISMDDPDMGQWNYVYNVLGEMVSQTNANNQTTNMTYDVLGRLKTATEPEGTTHWNYDSANNGIGMLASVVHYGGYSRTESYDALGRPSGTSTTINAINYTTSLTYNSVGRVDEITYPTGFKVKQEYTALGYLEKVVNANTPTTEYWTALATDEFGNVTLSNVGGILTAKDYEDNTGRLFDINAGLGLVQDLAYQYDTLGNLTQRKDELQNKTENFQYDDLNRLTTATVQGVGTKAFAYDVTGNMLSKSDVGSYLYGNNAGPHAVTSTTGTVNATYTYDNNGNMLTGNGRTITWSSYNKPIQVSKGQNIVSFNYGPDRARYQQVASDNVTTTTTTYIGSLYEKVQTGSNVEHKHYISAGNEVIAIHSTYSSQSNTTQYLHRDHLGSVDVITDGNQNVIEQLSFDAFGQRREASWNDAISQITSTITIGYTGHEQLDSVGLIHMNGRVYDAELGRFLSADPLVQQPKNYQNLNRYAYVFNNPLSYTDPSGFAVDDGSAFFGHGEFFDTADDSFYNDGGFYNDYFYDDYYFDDFGGFDSDFGGSSNMLPTITVTAESPSYVDSSDTFDSFDFYDNSFGQDFIGFYDVPFNTQQDQFDDFANKGQFDDIANTVLKSDFGSALNQGDVSPTSFEIEIARRLGATPGNEPTLPELAVGTIFAGAILIGPGGAKAAAIPLGFKSTRAFGQFSEALKLGLLDAGFKGTTAFMQGSSVTGRSFRTGRTFDTGRISDFDIALAGPDILARAKQLGIGLRSQGARTGPLNRSQIRQLGLGQLQSTLSQSAGRPVNFMIFRDARAVLTRSPSTQF